MGKKQGDCYCSSRHTKCCWQGLKNVKVTSSVKTDENVVDFKTMLDALSTSAGHQNISLGWNCNFFCYQLMDMLTLMLLRSEMYTVLVLFGKATKAL